MKLLCFLAKAVAHAKYRSKSLLLNILYHMLPHVFFRKIGRGNMFYGGIFFGNIGGDNITLGSHCTFGRSILLSASKGAQLNIGNRSSFNTGCHIVAVYGINIGDNVSIAEYVSIRDQNHHFKIYEQDGFTGDKIVIGSHVWIGRGSVIMPGVHIGDYSVIGANSVVTHNIPSHSVAVGSPARVIRSLQKEERNDIL